MIGIYGIKNRINGKIYIGQSVNTQDRFIRHRTHLKHKKHANQHPRLKMVENHPKTKLCAEDVKRIVELLLERVTHKKIAEQFNVARTVITRIASGARWSNITGGAINTEEAR